MKVVSLSQMCVQNNNVDNTYERNLTYVNIRKDGSGTMLHTFQVLPNTWSLNDTKGPGKGACY